MSKRKELIIKSYIYLLGGIALLSGIIAIFKGEYPFILKQNLLLCGALCFQ